MYRFQSKTSNTNTTFYQWVVNTFFITLSNSWFVIFIVSIFLLIPQKNRLDNRNYHHYMHGLLLHDHSVFNRYLPMSRLIHVTMASGFYLFIFPLLLCYFPINFESCYYVCKLISLHRMQTNSWLHLSNSSKQFTFSPVSWRTTSFACPSIHGILFKCSRKVLGIPLSKQEKMLTSHRTRTLKKTGL